MKKDKNNMEKIKNELLKIKHSNSKRSFLIKHWINEKGIKPEEISDRIEVLLDYPERFSKRQLYEIFEITNLNTDLIREDYSEQFE